MRDFTDCEAVHAENARSLKTLIKATTRPQGKLSLRYVICNYVQLRETVLEQLRENCAVPLYHLVLDPSSVSHAPILEMARSIDSPAVLTVSGWESVENINQLLVDINNARIFFIKQCTILILFVGSEAIHHKLMKLAPDMYSIFSTGSIKFKLSANEIVKFCEGFGERILNKIFNADSWIDLNNDLLKHFVLKQEQRWELNHIEKDLKKVIGDIPKDIEATLEFIRALDSHGKNQFKLALNHYQASLNGWNTVLDRSQDDLKTCEEPKHQWKRCKSAVELYLTLFDRNWSEFCPNERSHEYLVNAKRYIDRCLNTLNSIGDREFSTKLLGLLEHILYQLEEWNALEALVHQALPLHTNQPIDLAQDYTFLAKVAGIEGRWNDAATYAKQGVQLLEQVPKQCLQIRALSELILAEATCELGDIETAIAHLELVRTLEDARSNNGDRIHPALSIEILTRLRSLYWEQKNYLAAFQIKQEIRTREYQYGWRAFIGAAALKPKATNYYLSDNDSSDRVVNPQIYAFGRHDIVDELIHRLTGHNCTLIVIYGQSGVGKSSLVNAGLIPALSDKIIYTRTVVPIQVRSYNNWMRELGRSLIHDSKKIEQLELLHNPKDWIATAIETLKSNGDDLNLLTVLIFDQFEEFFFTIRDPASRRQFYEFFRDCLNIPFVKVILSIREDYLHYLLECDRVTNLDAINNNILDKNILYYIGNLSRTQTQSAIQNLTEESVFTLEHDLSDRLVEDLAAELGEVRPIELQVAGAQLQTEKITTLADYQAKLGDSPKVELVKRFLAEVVQDCGPENESVAKLVLYLLTDENNTRPLKTYPELAADIGRDPEQLTFILTVLVGSGLVFVVPDKPHDRYQLVHDYLASYIRQEQEPELRAELKLTKDQLRQTLYQEQQERKRAAIAEIQALTSLSKALLLSHDQLGALVAAVKAGKKVQDIAQEIEPSTALKSETIAQLKQTLYAMQERNRLDAHNGTVRSVSFSPDGKQLASGGDDRTVKLWKINGKQLQTFRGHKSWVRSVCFSPDGQTIASSSDDGTIKLWTIDGTELATWEGHGDRIWTVSFSPDGKRLVSGSDDRTIKLWTIDGKHLQTLCGHHNQVNTVKFSPDGQSIASSSKDGTIKLWSLDGQELRTLTGHGDWVWSLDFSPDGETMVSGCGGGSIKLWTVDGVAIETIYAHNRVRMVCFSPDGNAIASSGDDGMIRIWNLEGIEIQTLPGHQASVIALGFSPNGQVLASGSDDGTIRLWQYNRLAAKIFPGRQGITNSIAFSPDGRTIASGSYRHNDNRVVLWSNTGEKLQTLLGHPDGLRGVSFSGDGRMLASFSFDGTVKIWTANGEELETVWIERSISIAMSPDGEKIVAGCLDGCLAIYHLSTKKLLRLDAHQGRVWTVSFSPNGQLIASGSDDNTVKLWRVEDVEMRNFASLQLGVKTLHGHQSMVLSVCFSPDGKTIASAGGDRTIALWNLEGQELCRFVAHNSWVRGVHFSPDGNAIASCGQDNAIELWSLDGTKLRTLTGHLGAVKTLCFSPDGRTLVSGSDDSTIRLWQLDGEELNMNLDVLLTRGFDWLHDYLTHHPKVSEDLSLNVIRVNS